MDEHLPLELKLQCERFEIVDPAPNSTIKFSALYCPKSFAKTIFVGMPRVVQQEHLEGLQMFCEWHGNYLNFTESLKPYEYIKLEAYALNLYRMEFARGNLR